MTVSSTTSRWSYTGNGTVGPFAYTTEIFANTDLKVYVDGTLKTLTTHYTVTVGTSGNVTFTVGNEPANGSNVVIVKDVPNTQASSLPLGGAFPSTTVEDMVDKLTILVQQVVTRVTGRVLRQPDSDASNIGELPAKASRLGKYLRFNSTSGDPEVVSLSDIGSGAASDSSPQALGTAAAGTSTDYSRGDHVHPTTGIPVLATANTFTADQTFQSSDAGAGEGPTVTLDRNSASPAASDLIGVLRWLMRDSGAGSDSALKILGEIVDATAASEDARLLFQTIIAGTLATRMTLQNGMFMTGATGGDQGAGTINATNIYKNGSLVSGVRGALVYLTANESIANNTVTAIPWDAESYDTDGIWTSGSATRLTVPSGVTKVRLSSSANFAANATGQRQVLIYKNGAAFIGMPDNLFAALASGAFTAFAQSATVTVVAGDYFEANVWQTSGGALNVTNGEQTWFAMEILE